MDDVLCSRATASAAASTLSALLGFATPPLSSRRRPKRSTVELLSKVVDAHRSYWRGDGAQVRNFG